MRCRAGEVSFIEVPSDLRDVHNSLEIWGSWNRSPTRQAGKCGSLENRYRPEEEAGTPKILRPKLNQDEVDRVQLAVIRLPTNHRFMLQYWYVHRLHPNFIRRKLGIQNLDSVYMQLNAARYSIKSIMSGN